MRRVLLLLALTISCGPRSTGVSQAKAPTPTVTPTDSVVVSVGSTVRDVGAAIDRWTEFTRSHGTCPAGVVAKGCVTQEERDRVALALAAYAKERGQGRRLTTDTTQDTRKIILISDELVGAISDALTRAR